LEVKFLLNSVVEVVRKFLASNAQNAGIDVLILTPNLAAEFPSTIKGQLQEPNKTVHEGDDVNAG
jgi:hypothetical protein